MSKHGRQTQLRLFSMLVMTAVGSALVCGESTSPVPGFPDDLTLRAAHAANQPASIAVEEVAPYGAWRDNVQHYASIRVVYDYESWTTPDCPARKNYPELSDKEFIENSKSFGSLRVSRSGGTLDRNAGLQRYERNSRSPEQSTDGLLAKSSNYVKVHGDGVFYCFYPSRKSGAILKESRRDDHYPIVEVLPPDPATSCLEKVDETGTVLDFRSEDSQLIRYHLDPEQGMMPVRIEYHQILENGELFLFRFYTVEEYTQTEKAVFVPSKCTLHDLAHVRDDGSLSVLKRSRYVLATFEDVETFEPEEFIFAFPEGTRVRNNFTGGEFVEGVPGK